MEYKGLVFCLLIWTAFGEDKVKFMKTFSKHIGNVVLECQREMQFGPLVILEFYQFWNTAHILTNKIQGCVIVCIFSKLSLLPAPGIQDYAYAYNFMVKNGANDETIATFKDLYKLCSDAAMTKNVQDGCIYALEIAKCFRYGIFSMDWAPPYIPNAIDELEDEELEDEELEEE